MIALFALAAAAAHPSIPAQFVGRWETNVDGCAISKDNKNEADFVVIELTQMWTYEADDRILAIEALSANRLVLKVVTASEGFETTGRAVLQRIGRDRLRIRFGADWDEADYVKCPPARQSGSSIPR